MIDWATITLKELAGYISEEFNIFLEQEIDLAEIEKWSISELNTEKFNFFKKALKKKAQ